MPPRGFIKPKGDRAAETLLEAYKRHEVGIAERVKEIKAEIAAGRGNENTPPESRWRKRVDQGPGE